MDQKKFKLQKLAFEKYIYVYLRTLKSNTTMKKFFILVAVAVMGAGALAPCMALANNDGEKVISREKNVELNVVSIKPVSQIEQPIYFEQAEEIEN